MIATSNIFSKYSQEKTTICDNKFHIPTFPSNNELVLEKYLLSFITKYQTQLKISSKNVYILLIYS